NQVFGRNLEVVEKKFARGMVHHRSDRPDGQALAQCRPYVDQEHGKTLGPLVHQITRSRPAEEEHEVRMLCSRGPELLAIHDIAVALAPGGRGERAGVAAAGGFGDAEGLRSQAPGGNLWQVALLLRLRSVSEQRTHGIHLRMTGGRIAPLPVYFLEDGGGG